MISLQLWGKRVMVKSASASAGNIFVCSLGTAALLWVKPLMHNLRNYLHSLVNILHPNFSLAACCLLSSFIAIHF